MKYIDEALRKRRSVREYLEIPLTDEPIAHLTWADQGMLHKLII